ncbi:hypothetical protein F511_26174 [Dorcoceras hygrometricum]|uniref:Uncharacterized protein n=1 Tax=Dorcoceras hygrometricum TaxID=472368 RepID=A0A2Z7AAR4_9LAMI|nr:hypothetical protein F511_26174 [Dorcoceras hygrometricum]
MGKKAVKQNPEKCSMEKMSRRSKNKKNYGKAQDEAVDDVNAKKIGKQFYSRCSPTYFSNVMSELKPILGEQQRMRISDSPFSKWIGMPVLAISSGRLDYILNRFHVPSCSFIITDDVMIPFRSSDFSIVLGLHHSGQSVDLDLKIESRFLARHFARKVTKADRAAIRERMMLLAGSSEENEVLPIQPFNEEENLVDLKRVEKSEDGMSEVRILEKVVIRQSEEIKLLKKRCGELEDQNMRHVLNVKEAVVEKGEKSGKGVGEVEKSRGKAGFEIAHDAVCSFYDVDVVVHNVVAELDKANKDVERYHNEDPSDEGREVDRSNESTRGSDFSLSKVDEITAFQSSIVDNVRKMDDRVKKRKWSMFVTPPSSTPKRKTRLVSMGQSFVDVDEASNSRGEEELDEFRGRSDFIGHEKPSDEDRNRRKEELRALKWRTIDSPLVAYKYRQNLRVSTPFEIPQLEKQQAHAEKPVFVVEFLHRLEASAVLQIVTVRFHSSFVRNFQTSCIRVLAKIECSRALEPSRFHLADHCLRKFRLNL